MTQDAEVPPVVPGSPSSGGFVTFVAAGGALYYQLIAYNVTEVTMVSTLLVSKERVAKHGQIR